MSIKPKELESILVNKYDFSPAEHRSHDHRWYELKLPGLPVITTKVSHSRKPLGKTIQGKIARQMRVRNPYLVGMVSCKHSREDYYDKVRIDPFPPYEHRF